MHELAICESIRSAIEEQARLQHFTRVKRVALEIGPLAGVETESLRFGFDVAMKGSVAADALLEVIAPQASAWCMPCASTVPIASRGEACPKCGSYQLQVVAGDELRIKELEVE